MDDFLGDENGKMLKKMDEPVHHQAFCETNG